MDANNKSERFVSRSESTSALLSLSLSLSILLCSRRRSEINKYYESAFDFIIKLEKMRGARFSWQLIRTHVAARWSLHNPSEEAFNGEREREKINGLLAAKKPFWATFQIFI